MATNPFNTPRLNLNTELIDIFNDNVSVAQISAPQLPGGACNFVNLTSGASASKCGCRRFWARPAQGSPLMDQALYCMCEHHACYHDQGGCDLQPGGPAVATTGPENVKPSTGRDPLSPLFHLDINMAPTGTPKPDHTVWSGVDQLSFLQQSLEGAVVSIADASPRPVASIPDTLVWADVIQPQPDTTNKLPPIPPQRLMPSQATSTTSSVQAKYMRPFAGKGLHTLKAASTATQTPPESQAKPTDLAPLQQPNSMPCLRESFGFLAQEGETPARPETATTQDEPRTNAGELFSREDVRNLTDIVNTHAHRLDKLETFSFSAANHEECLDRHDHLDLRITELESRLEETEKMALASANTRQDDDSSTVSGASSRASYSQDFYSKLQSLQAQVSHLQTYIPSHSHAWEVEVVFLPFPLQRIWQTSHQFKDPSMSHGDDSTQLPMTHSTSTLRQFSESESTFWEGCAPRGHDLEWLLPKAFSDISIADKRLKSRGLVQKITINGPEANVVQTTINNAFGSVFRDMQMHSRSFESNSRLSRFMGLQSPWVPLRKIHRDGRLRFLNPDEMLTPMMWNVEFLNSVMMKSSHPRLFITHPDAYVQDRHTYETGWTWKKLKEINSPCPDFTESQQVPEMEELDECWAWNEQLDDAPKAQMPLIQRHERHRVSISPSVAYFPAPVAAPDAAAPSRRSMSPYVTRDLTPVSANRRDSRASSTRPMSLPPSTSLQELFSITNPKRRVASNGQSRRTTPSTMTTPAAKGHGGISKRRRTRSPSHAHFTPRWTVSPSPAPAGFHERQAARNITPYATPFSNAPLQELQLVRGGSVMMQQSDEEFPIYENDVADEDHEMATDDGSSDTSVSDASSEDDETSAARAPAVTLVQPDVQRNGSSSRPRPEDVAWTGIEGDSSDGENIDPWLVEQEAEQENDQVSDASSQPSEYPTTQSAWAGDASDENGFRIHEDMDNE